MIATSYRSMASRDTLSFGHAAVAASRGNRSGDSVSRVRLWPKLRRRVYGKRILAGRPSWQQMSSDPEWADHWGAHLDVAPALARARGSTDGQIAPCPRGRAC